MICCIYYFHMRFYFYFYIKCTEFSVNDCSNDYSQWMLIWCIFTHILGTFPFSNTFHVDPGDCSGVVTWFPDFKIYFIVTFNSTIVREHIQCTNNFDIFIVVAYLLVLLYGPEYVFFFLYTLENGLQSASMADSFLKSSLCHVLYSVSFREGSTNIPIAITAFSVLLLNATDLL